MRHQRPIPINLRGGGRSHLGNLAVRLGPEWSRARILEMICRRVLRQAQSMPVPQLRAWLQGDLDLRLVPAEPKEEPPRVLP